MLVINHLHDNYGNLLDSLERYNKATDTILCDCKAEKTGFVIFINQNDVIESIAKYKIGRRIATRKNSIKFHTKKDLPWAITKDELQNSLTRFKSTIADMYGFTTTASLTPALGENIADFILAKNPELSDYFKAEKFYKEIRIENTPHLENEFDAISIPLKMIDLKDISFTKRTLTENEPLLECIYSANMVEDQMITHDQTVFMSSEFQKENFFSGKTFINYENGASVNVFYANRTPWEKVTGVDLILYNVAFHSFLFIQYKRMGEESEKYIYRPDKQLDEEIKRMQALSVNTVKNIGSRLNANPFYLKFCPSRQSGVLSGELKLIKGIILPLHSFLNFRESGYLSGKKGGEILTYENVPHYMDNTLFMNLYKNGWIGSSEIDKDSIEQYITERLDNGHSFFVAQYNEEKPRIP